MVHSNSSSVPKGSCRGSRPRRAYPSDCVGRPPRAEFRKYIPPSWVFVFFTTVSKAFRLVGFGRNVTATVCCGDATTAARPSHCRLADHVGGLLGGCVLRVPCGLENQRGDRDRYLVARAPRSAPAHAGPRSAVCHHLVVGVSRNFEYAPCCTGEHRRVVDHRRNCGLRHDTVRWTRSHRVCHCRFDAPRFMWCTCCISTTGTRASASGLIAT